MSGGLRRQYLRLAAVAGLTGLAGCASTDIDLIGSTNDTADSNENTPTEQDPSDTGTDADMPLTAREPGWVQQFGSGTNLRYNPVPGPSESPDSQWRIELPSGGQSRFVATSDVIARFGAEQPLAAHDPGSGDRRWQISENELADGSSPSGSGRFLLANGQVVLQILAGNVPTLGVDPETGERLWQAEGIVPIVDDGRLYTLTQDESEIVLQRRGSDGTVADSARFSLPSNARNIGAVGAGVVIFRTSREAEEPRLTAVDIADGSVRWETTTPAPFPSANEGFTPQSNVLMTGRTVFTAVITDPGINLVAYDLADGSERWRAFDADELSQMPTDGFGISGARNAAGAPGYCYVRTPRDLIVYDERSGESLTTVQDVNTGGQSDNTLRYVAASARNSTYLIENDFDEPAAVSLLAMHPDLSQERWSLSLTDRQRIASVYPTGEQLLVRFNTDNAGELVAFG